MGTNQLNKTFFLISFFRNEENAPEEHKETRKKLKSLGICDEKMANSLNRQNRNSVTGAYQIVLHQIQKNKYKTLKNTEFEVINKSAESAVPEYSNKPSRLCLLF